MKPLLKRLAVVLSLLMVFSILLSACGTPDQSTVSSGNQKKTTTSKKVASSSKSTFTTSDYFDPPPSIHGNPWAPPGLGGIGGFVFDKLFEYLPPNDEYVPQLGESFETKDNQTIVHLRKGVKWSDGETFTSKDVIATYNLGFLSGWVVWRYLDKIEAPDDYTVVFTWKKNGPLMNPIAFNSLITAPYHVYGKWSDQIQPYIAKRDANGNVDDATNKELTKIREDLYKFKPDVTKVVGNGPYEIENVTSSEAILRKRQDYYAAKDVKIDQVRIQRYTTTEAYLSMAMAGKYDSEPHGITNDVLNQIKKKQPQMKVIMPPDGYNNIGLIFNQRVYPLNDVNVRRAIAFAIDKAPIIDVVEAGGSKPDLYNCGIALSVQDKWLLPDAKSKLTEYNYNPQKAEEILKSIGWQKGSDGFWRDTRGQLVQLQLASISAWPTFLLGGEAIANQLNKFGIKVEYKPMEVDAYWEYLNNGQHQMAIEFPESMGGYGHPWDTYRHIYIDLAARLGLVDPKATNPKLSLNVKLSSGETIDVYKLIDELFYTMDLNQQKEITAKLAEATNKLVPFMGFVEKNVLWKVYNPNLAGYPDNPMDGLFWNAGGVYADARMIKLGKLYIK